MNFIRQWFMPPAPHPAMHRLFCKVEMRGCMAETRGAEKWGVVVEFQRGRAMQGLIYDGGQHPESRERQMKQGQDDWVLVRYSDGSRIWEPLWWCLDRGDYLEYQT